MSINGGRMKDLILMAGLVLVFSPVSLAASPKISKAFNPTSIVVNEFATLVIEFLNQNSNVARFTAPFNETLPDNMVILGSGSTSCGGILTAEPGGKKLTLARGKIPAYGSCYIQLGVTATKVGSFTSLTPAAALQTDKGINLLASDVTLTVTNKKKSTVKKSF